LPWALNGDERIDGAAYGAKSDLCSSRRKLSHVGGPSTPYNRAETLLRRWSLDLRRQSHRAHLRARWRTYVYYQDALGTQVPRRQRRAIRQIGRRPYPSRFQGRSGDRIKKLEATDLRGGWKRSLVRGRSFRLVALATRYIGIWRPCSQSWSITELGDGPTNFCGTRLSLLICR
jgi:hypothetical protein